MGTIAVFTVFKNTNYGAVLQAYALSRVLKDVSGRDVFLVDYIRDQNTNLMHNGIVFHGKHGAKTVNSRSLKKAFKSLLNFPGTVERTRVFLDFINEHLVVYPHPFFSGDAIHLEGFDCAFLGSDQIWNPKLLKGFHNAYFGITNPKLSRVVAYAPSLGKTTFTDKEKQELGRKLENVDVLSCREEQGCRFLEELTGRHVERVLDPTLLLPAEEWQTLADSHCALPDKYVLVYSLLFDKWLMEQAMAKARSAGAQVVLLGMGDGIPPKGVKYEKAFGPRQFISSISRASCIFTDSFHGTAFSILFGKPFVVRAHGEKGQRMENLCRLLGLGDRVFRETDELPEMDAPIDYGRVHRTLEGLRMKSRRYIEDNVNV